MEISFPNFAHCRSALNAVVVVVIVVVADVVVVFATLHFGEAALSQTQASFALQADNLSAEQSLPPEASDASSNSAPPSEARLHSFLSVLKEHAALALHFFFLSPVHSLLELESVSEARLHFGEAVLSQVHALFALHANDLSTEQSVGLESSVEPESVRLQTAVSSLSVHAEAKRHARFLRPLHSSLATVTAQLVSKSNAIAGRRDILLGLMKLGSRGGKKKNKQRYKMAHAAGIGSVNAQYLIGEEPGRQAWLGQQSVH